MKRRDFLVGLGLSPLAAAIPSSSLSLPTREPYGKGGDFPDSIVWHMWERPLMPIGPLRVTDVLPYDGVGYPIIVATLGWREQDRVHYPGGYDHDWSVIRRDVPGQFWAQPGSSRYPNIHAYIREQRFGEPPSVMREAMDRNQRAPWQPRPHISPLGAQNA